MFDLWVYEAEAGSGYAVSPVGRLQSTFYAPIIFAVAHPQFNDMGAENICALRKSNSVLYV